MNTELQKKVRENYKWVGDTIYSIRRKKLMKYDIYPSGNKRFLLYVEGKRISLMKDRLKEILETREE